MAGCIPGNMKPLTPQAPRNYLPLLEVVFADFNLSGHELNGNGRRMDAHHGPLSRFETT